MDFSLGYPVYAGCGAVQQPFVGGPSRICFRALPFFLIHVYPLPADLCLSGHMRKLMFTLR